MGHGCLDLPPPHARRALRDARSQLRRTALKLLGWLALAYLVLKLLPGLKQALHSLEHVGWEWVVGAIALEVLSEFGYALSWRSIVDPENLLERDGRGARTATRAAWAQLGGGMLVPGGSIASTPRGLPRSGRSRRPSMRPTESCFIAVE